MRNMMNAWNTFRRFGGLALAALLLTGCQIANPTADNQTKWYIVVSSINGNAVLQSDVVTKGEMLNDAVKVTFSYQLRGQVQSDFSTRPDSVTFNRYHVSYARSDGGQPLESFTADTHVVLLRPAKTDEPSTVEASIVVVRAFEKNRLPLSSLWTTGQLFMDADITFYGADAYGREVAVSGSLLISFGNFADSSK